MFSVAASATGQPMLHRDSQRFVPRQLVSDQLLRQTTTGAMPVVAPTDATVFAQPGPFSVGFTSIALPDKALMQLWYPSETNANNPITTVTEDLRSLLDAKDVAKFKSSPLPWKLQGTRNGEPATIGPSPVVLFSHDSRSHHGDSLLPLQIFPGAVLARLLPNGYPKRSTYRVKRKR
jgi:hypothetical protein